MGTTFPDAFLLCMCKFLNKYCREGLLAWLVLCILPGGGQLTLDGQLLHFSHRMSHQKGALSPGVP